MPTSTKGKRPATVVSPRAHSRRREVSRQRRHAKLAAEVLPQRAAEAVAHQVLAVPGGHAAETQEVSRVDRRVRLVVPEWIRPQAGQRPRRRQEHRRKHQATAMRREERRAANLRIEAIVISPTRRRTVEACRTRVALFRAVLTARVAGVWVALASRQCLPARRRRDLRCTLARRQCHPARSFPFNRAEQQDNSTTSLRAYPIPTTLSTRGGADKMGGMDIGSEIIHPHRRGLWPARCCWSWSLRLSMVKSAALSSSTGTIGQQVVDNPLVNSRPGKESPPRGADRTGDFTFP